MVKCNFNIVDESMRYFYDVFHKINVKNSHFFRHGLFRGAHPLIL
jgi:hypothetical protein